MGSEIGDPGYGTTGDARIDASFDCISVVLRRASRCSGEFVGLGP